MTIGFDPKTESLLQFLDHAIDGYAQAFDVDADLALFMLIAAVISAARLGLSEKSVRLMASSAVAEVRRKARAKPTPRAAKGKK